MAAMGDLSSHLKQTGTTQADFAARIGVDQATVSKLCRGKLLPSLPLAVAIERATDGQIKAVSWVSDEDAA